MVFALVNQTTSAAAEPAAPGYQRAGLVVFGFVLEVIENPSSDYPLLSVFRGLDRPYSKFPQLGSRFPLLADHCLLHRNIGTSAFSKTWRQNAKSGVNPNSLPCATPLSPGCPEGYGSGSDCPASSHPEAAEVRVAAWALAYFRLLNSDPLFSITIDNK